MGRVDIHYKSAPQATQFAPHCPLVELPDPTFRVPTFNMNILPHDTGPYTCSDCQYEFPIRKSLVRHLKTVHRRNNVACNHCGSTFARKDVLDRHIRTQHDEHNKMVSCNVCGKLVRFRSLPAHRVGDACKAASVAIDLSDDTQASIWRFRCEEPMPEPLRSQMSTSSPQVSALQPNTIHVQVATVGWSQDLPYRNHRQPLDEDRLVELSTRNACRRQLIDLDDLDAMFGEFVVSVRGTRVQKSLFSKRRQEGYIAPPAELAAIASPVLLSAWLFIKLNPWGPNNCWANESWIYRPPQVLDAPSVEVLGLRQVVYGTILNAMLANDIDRDPYFPDALIMLTMFTCMTEGWEAAILHTQPLVRLASMQIVAQGGSREAFRTTAAVEAFRTVLSRYVMDQYAEILERMFTSALMVMRHTAIDLIDNSALQHIEGPVWDRVFLVRPNSWYSNYKEQLLPIKKLADSIPYNAEKQ